LQWTRYLTPTHSSFNKYGKYLAPISDSSCYNNAEPAALDLRENECAAECEADDACLAWSTTPCVHHFEPCDVITSAGVKLYFRTKFSGVDVDVYPEMPAPWAFPDSQAMQTFQSPDLSIRECLNSCFHTSGCEYATLTMNPDKVAACWLYARALTDASVIDGNMTIKMLKRYNLTDTTATPYVTYRYMPPTVAPSGYPTNQPTTSAPKTSAPTLSDLETAGLVAIIVVASLVVLVGIPAMYYSRVAYKSVIQSNRP
jgi:hypothetical protein